MLITVNMALLEWRLIRSLIAIIGFIFTIFYLAAPELIAQISRFTIVNDSLDLISEKKYIQIPYDNTCCHTGGSMSFDSKGNLYFSTGDNTDAFQTTYSPHDERAGA